MSWPCCCCVQCQEPASFLGPPVIEDISVERPSPHTPQLTNLHFSLPEGMSRYPKGSLVASVLQQGRACHQGSQQCPQAHWRGLPLQGSSPNLLHDMADRIPGPRGRSLSCVGDLKPWVGAYVVKVLSWGTAVPTWVCCLWLLICPIPGLSGITTDNLLAISSQAL